MRHSRCLLRLSTIFGTFRLLPGILGARPRAVCLRGGPRRPLSPILLRFGGVRAVSSMDVLLVPALIPIAATRAAIRCAGFVEPFAQMTSPGKDLVNGVDSVAVEYALEANQSSLGETARVSSWLVRDSSSLCAL